MLWGEKPYYSLDYYLKETFGEKIYKIALDGGMTCPNRDGSIDDRGCIFCSQGGSGEFAIKQQTTVSSQIQNGIDFLQKQPKYCGRRYIAYFQSYSNTYAPASYLRSIYMEALHHPQIAALSIATRPDCFSPEIYQLLKECRQIKPVWIELGLQTIHEDTARYIRRGYSLSVYEDTVHQLRKRNLDVITHVILGLPGESTEQILETIHYLNGQNIQGIKLQLLHILKGTDLAKELDHLNIYTQAEYIDVLLQCIAHLSPDIVIHRLTGDGPKDLLLAPLWSQNKRAVLNDIAHQLKIQHIYQGCRLS
ncbi:MAG: TIGR01212 family radical SAM protein [Lachnospiraceae bacterium]|nr:TIGR01212 family radical SAM protein [Lachnospiraceae bacterium]